MHLLCPTASAMVVEDLHQEAERRAARPQRRKKLGHAQLQFLMTVRKIDVCVYVYTLVPERGPPWSEPEQIFQNYTQMSIQDQIGSCEQLTLAEPMEILFE